jgi:serine/threonine protein kinase
VLLGTAAYTSAEQARGRAADKRTDIRAFGCLVYEMLTGQPALLGGAGVSLAERDPVPRADRLVPPHRLTAARPIRTAIDVDDKICPACSP